MLNIVTLNQSNLHQCISENRIMFLNFWAAWCGPCKMMSPILDDIVEEFDHVEAMGRINVDECFDISAKYRVENISTLLVLKEGKEIGRIEGYRNSDDMKAEIDRILR